MNEEKAKRVARTILEMLRPFNEEKLNSFRSSSIRLGLW